MTQRPKVNKIWASSGEIEQPDSAKYSSGWIRAEKPEHTHENYLTNNDQRFNKECVEEGIPFWRNNVTYKKGALVKYSAEVYIAKASNLNKQPDTHINVDWEKSFGDKLFTEAKDSLLKISNITDKHLANVDNPHNLVPSQADTYTTSEFDNKVGILHNNITRHINKQDNIHRVTYTQLNILPVSGGDFEKVDFASKVAWTLGDVAPSKDKVVFGSVSKKYMGISDDAIFDDKYIIHTGNYLRERNRIEGLYSVPMADIELPFTGSINSISEGVDADYSWDNPAFTSDGLTLAGTVSFDAVDGLGQQLSIGFKPKGHVMATIGDVTMTWEGSGLEAQDGWNSLSHDGEGFFLYVREATRGVLYLNGSKVAEGNYEALTSHTAASITGTGSIRDLKIWSFALTEEQASSVR